MARVLTFILSLLAAGLAGAWAMTQWPHTPLGGLSTGVLAALSFSVMWAALTRA